MKHYPFSFLILLSLLLHSPVQAKSIFKIGESDKTALISFEPGSPSAETPFILTYYPFYFIDRGDLDAIPLTGTKEKEALLFRVPATHPGYISIGLKGGEPVVRLFLVQGGTKVTIREEGGILHFSGKNAALFECQAALQEIRWKQPISEAENDYWNSRPYAGMVRQQQAEDSFYGQKQQLLQQYKKKVDPLLYRILEADCQGIVYYNLYGNLGFSLDMAADDPDRQQELIRFYQEHLQNAVFRNFAPEAVYSRTLADGLLEKSKVDMRMRQNRYLPRDSAFTMASLYQWLGTHYNGPLLEKQAIVVMNRFSGLPDEMPLLKEAGKSLSEPYFQSLLQGFLTRIPGAPAYPFTLEDHNGRLVRLADFKGKTIVMKFWTLGCPFCESLEHRMKALRQEVPAADDVVFIDVCVDNKEQWEKGLASGLYSNNDALQLYLGGQGTTHPLLMQYGYSGFPALLLIDKNGRVLSSKPDRPFGPEQTAAFLKLLEPHS